MIELKVAFLVFQRSNGFGWHIKIMCLIDYFLVNRKHDLAIDKYIIFYYTDKLFAISADRVVVGCSCCVVWLFLLFYQILTFMYPAHFKMRKSDLCYVIMTLSSTALLSTSNNTLSYFSRKVSYLSFKSWQKWCLVWHNFRTMYGSLAGLHLQARGVHKGSIHPGNLRVTRPSSDWRLTAANCDRWRRRWLLPLHQATVGVVWCRIPLTSMSLLYSSSCC